MPGERSSLSSTCIQKWLNYLSCLERATSSMRLRRKFRSRHARGSNIQRGTKSARHQSRRYDVQGTEVYRRTSRDRPQVFLPTRCTEGSSLYLYCQEVTGPSERRVNVDGLP